MPVPFVPDDIWRNVAQYLPQNILFGLRSVNTAFHELASAVTYRCLTVDKWDKKTRQKLKEIGHSHASYHVREVSLCPGAISFMDEYNVLKTSKIWTSLNTMVDRGYLHRKYEAMLKKRTKKYVRLVTDAIYALPSVTKYHLKWSEECEHASQHDMVNSLLAPLLSQPSFGHNLQNLSLKLPPDKLGRLSHVALPRLSELKVHFITKDLSTKQIMNQLDGFMIFLNNLFGTLTSLMLTSTVSSSYLDFSPFFKRLGHFPHLSSLTLMMPFDGSHISDPTVLIDFIRRHSHTLDKIRLRGKRIGVRHCPPSAESRIWIRRTVEDIGVADTGTWPVRSLEIALRPLKADLTPLYDCVARLSPQLRSLVLTERSLTFEEVARLLDLFMSAPLRRLGIRVRRLSPELLDMLAARLPELQVLELTFLEVIHRESDHCGPAGREVSSFLRVMARRRYLTWHLSAMALTESPFKDVLWLDRLEKSLIECIPGLRIREIPLSLTE